MADEADDMVVRLSRMEAFSDGVFAIAITPACAGAFDTGGLGRASAQSSAQPLALLSGVYRQLCDNRSDLAWS
jgi:hypothetical protein